MLVQCSEIDKVIERIQGEYREMPGLSLTEVQARRVWDLDDRSCTAALDTLVAMKFLIRTRAGTYVRLR
jgi:hypothetical protein